MAMKQMGPVETEKVILKVYDSATYKDFAEGRKMETVRAQTGQVYQDAYENSKFWPLYEKGDIGPVWGRELAKFTAANGILIVAQDEGGKVLGSLMSVPFSKVLDSHSEQIEPVIAKLKEIYGEDRLRQMHYIVDTTVHEDTQHSGVGTKMYEQYFNELKRRGFTSAIDWTSPVEGNPAVDFNQKAGFVELSERMRGIEWSGEGKVPTGPATVSRGNATEATDKLFHFESQEGAVYMVKPLPLEQPQAEVAAASEILKDAVRRGEPPT
ncbi:GNAT family N-acetyltransferase [Candidatus Marsarchaeota archaeon]|nr:GNAT family N-acetyltransferase [Candidatus Marsarchaeota archaeon]